MWHMHLQELDEVDIRCEDESDGAYERRGPHSHDFDELSMPPRGDGMRQAEVARDVEEDGREELHQLSRAGRSCEGRAELCEGRAELCEV